MTDELIAIRCVTCNKVLANLWNKYEKMLEEGVSVEEALNRVGLTRPCCRLRLRNPFKVVERSNQNNQGEVTKTFEDNFDRLSISTDSEAPNKGALSALSSVSAMTIIPEEEESDVILPPIPIIPKSSSKEQKNNRVYTAW